jgi:MFS transporter, AAHS family, 4-hydroxybenzoate transporter
MNVTSAAAVDIPAWIDRQKVSTLQVTVACLCGVAVMLDGFDSQIIGFVAPALIQEFKVPPAALAPAFSAGLFGILAGCLLLAPLADWVGRRWVMIVSVFVFAVATLITSRVETVRELEIVRFLTGIGLGACMPNALALTAEYAPLRLRGALTAWMFTGFSLGAAIGGFIAAQAIPHFGWRPLFVAGGIAPLLVLLVMIVFLPESVRYLAAKGGSSSQIAAILARIRQDPAIKPGSSFVMSEESRGGFTLPHLFHDRRTAGTLTLWAMFFLMLFDVFLLASWTPTVLASSGLPRETAVFTGAMQQVGSVAATLALGPLFDRIGFYRSLIPLFLAAAVGVVVMGTASISLPLLHAGAFFAGAGIMGGQTSLIVLAGAFYPTFIRATGVGWGLGIGRIGAIIGPLIGGWMVANEWSPHEIFMVAALPPIIVAALLLLMRRYGCVGTMVIKAAEAIAH